jgi:hypothetical protein
MVRTMKGERSGLPVGRNLGVSLVRQCGRAHNIPAQGVHGGNHEPLHDGAKRVHPEEEFVRRIRYPVLFMRTNQPNQRPPNHNLHATQLDRGVSLPVLFAWWEKHFVYSRGPRVRAITAVAFRHRSVGDADTARQSDRSARTKLEPVRLTVSPASATIMKVVARHEGDSKMDDPLCGSWERCRWHHAQYVPEVHSGSLRWQK